VERKLTARPPLLCFSHLRWDFVWQRPQQVVSRLARDREVIFVEEPVFRDGAGSPAAGATLELRAADGVTVARPVCADPGPGGGPALDAMYARLVADLVRDRDLGGFTAWFYTPMLLPAISRRAPGLVVYDAMDELSLFRGAPPALLPRERRLLAQADLVFTGGVSLGRAKARLHPRVYAFPSGVEVEHYRRALSPRTRVPRDLAALPGPRAGFFGVIDERLDLDLLDGLAQARPDVQLVLLGPVAKIDPADLPRRPNLHYLGQKQYRDLPAYVKGFDVCLMPFARNAATRFISPTKTLEYMAAHKPIVSTPVADVVGQYGGPGGAVQIAGDVNTFSTAIDTALGETSAEREARVARERRLLERSTWESIVARMDERMREAEAAPADTSRAPSPGSPALRRPAAVAGQVVLAAGE
jgi:UDP-galactopyranose mutase